MPKVMMLAPGQTGYVPVRALCCTRPGQYPAILREIYTNPAEAGPNPLLVRNNPLERRFVVTIRRGVRAIHRPALITSLASFFYVALLLPDGTWAEDRIPDCYWQSSQ